MAPLTTATHGRQSSSDPGDEQRPEAPGPLGHDGAPRRRGHGPSIRVRLLALVVIAVVPAGLVGASIVRSWSAASEDDAARSVQRLAEAAALHQENLVVSTQVLLEALSMTPSVTDRETCASTMRDLSGALPQYAVMGVADADGDFWCSSQPTEDPVSVIDRSYFLAARSTGESAVGRYQIGRVTGKPTVVVAHPMLAEDDSFAGVVVASIDLSRPAVLAEQLDLPEGSTVTVFDEAGTVLMRWPVSEGYVGSSAAEHVEALRTSSTVRTPGLDGVDRVYGADDIVGAENALLLSVGVPAAAVESAAGAALGTAAWWFAVIIVAAGAAAIAMARSTVLQPVRRLRRAATRLTAGDFSARAAFSGGGELSALAEDFDTMALALLEREQELRLSEQRVVEERYRGLLDIAADAVVVLDGSGRVLLFNRGAEELFGARADEVRGKAHGDALGADLLAGHEHCVLDHAGDPRWVEARWSEGTDGLTTVIVRDVSDRHRAQEAAAVLRERDERFRLAQEHSAIGLALVGLDGRWLDVNPALCRIVGRSQDELLALTFQDITHPDDLDADLAHVDQLLDGEIDGYEMVKRYLDPDGRAVWVQLNGSVVRDEQRSPLYFVAQVQDITADRQRQEQLERHRHDLERSNAELEQFAYVASHDLSEPLRSISGFAVLLEEEVGDELSGDARTYLRFMVAGTTRMQALIDDLLAFSRVNRSALRVEVAELDDVVEQVRAGLSAAIAATGARLDVGPLPPVQASRSLMAQLFQNLVSNALKFHAPDIQPVVRVSCLEQDGERATFVVEDNGIGIEPKYRDRVFRMFQRLHTRTEYEGTGMGLALCAKIVESLGGRISIEDSALGGVAFHLTLPLAEEAP